MDPTTEGQKKAIEEMRKHPLWEDFCVSYEKAACIHPDKSCILVLVVTYWQIFLDGVEAADRLNKLKVG